MKIEIIQKKEVEVKTVSIDVCPRYWEDGIINGVPGDEIEDFPMRDGDNWKLTIDVETGIIQNWPKGTTADIHFKVCDAGSYYLHDEKGEVVASIEEDYVPNNLIPGKYGDYIIMNIGETGKIENWDPSFDDFNNN